MDEVYGNKINKDVLYESIKNVISNGEKIINLEFVNCYENFKYILKFKEVIDIKNFFNDYVNIIIIYNFGDKIEVLNGVIINNWF